MDSTLWAALIGALGGIVVAILGLAPLYRKLQKQKDVAEIDTINAEAMREIIGAAKTLYEIATKQSEEAHIREGILVNRIDGLENDLTQTRSSFRKAIRLYVVLWAGFDKLYQQLLALKQTPAFEPPEETHPDEVQKLLETD